MYQTYYQSKSRKPVTSTPLSRQLSFFSVGLKCVKECGSNMMPVSSLFPPKPSKPLVRLVGGKNKQEGRVEVFYAGQWGTVCDDGWDMHDATIVCKELGFGRAKEAPLHSKFEKGEPFSTNTHSSLELGALRDYITSQLFQFIY